MVKAKGTKQAKPKQTKLQQREAEANAAIDEFKEKMGKILGVKTIGAPVMVTLATRRGPITLLGTPQTEIHILAMVDMWLMQTRALAQLMSQFGIPCQHTQHALAFLSEHLEVDVEEAFEDMEADGIDQSHKEKPEKDASEKPIPEASVVIPHGKTVH